MAYVRSDVPTDITFVVVLAPEAHLGRYTVDVQELSEQLVNRTSGFIYEDTVV